MAAWIRLPARRIASMARCAYCDARQALNSFGIPFGWLRIGLDHFEDLERRYGQGMIDAALKTVTGTVEGNLGPLDV